MIVLEEVQLLQPHLVISALSCTPAFLRRDSANRGEIEVEMQLSFGKNVSIVLYFVFTFFSTLRCL